MKDPEINNENANIAALAYDREKIIVRTSIIGIIANVLLAAFKAAVGLISNSIAVILDAVNNLSDALSSDLKTAMKAYVEQFERLQTAG